MRETAGQHRDVGYGEKIVSLLEDLAQFSSEPDRLTRLYLTPSHRQAVDRVQSWMREAGMTARIDGLGTVVGRWEGRTPDAPTLLLGSHIDTVRDGGRFDGALGVVTAIAVVEALHKKSQRLPFAVEVVAFGDEEGVRFSSTLTGSQALAGRFDPATLDERDHDGVSRADALHLFGIYNGTADLARIIAEQRDPAKVIGYLEVHIEQGPVLEAEGVPLGIVTAISGVTRCHVTVTGQSGHAGTVPMPLRRDALVAAAEMIVAIETLGRATPDLVATVGRLDVANAAINTIPGHVRFSVDVRSALDATRAMAMNEIGQRISAIAANRQVTLAISAAFDASAAACDPKLSHVLEGAVREVGLPVRSIPSGAGHDAMAFSGKIPFAMLFVRCRGGISHHPAEYASIEDIDTAARVLERCILTLAQ